MQCLANEHGHDLAAVSACVGRHLSVQEIVTIRGDTVSASADPLSLKGK